MRIASLKSLESQSSSTQGTIAQVDPNHVNLENSTAKIRPTQVSSIQFSSYTSSSKADTSKVSLSNSVSSEQFINSYISKFHDYLSPKIFDINNSALNYWNSFLKAQTPFDINFIFKDLPVEQLANVTVVYKATEFIPQIRIETLHIGTTVLGINAGIEDQVDLSKIPLTSSIALQQFFNCNILPFHTFIFVSNNTYKYKPLNLWSTLFNYTNSLLRDALTTCTLLWHLRGSASNTSSYAIAWEPVSNSSQDPTFLLHNLAQLFARNRFHTAISIT